MEIDSSPSWSKLPDYFSPAYLLAGTPRQQEVYSLLLSEGVFEVLREYSPCLAGTIPLGVDIPESDADIICEVRNHEAFRRLLLRNFRHCAAFEVREGKAQERVFTLASFRLSFENLQMLRVEIFGQTLPVQQQNAYRHLVVEARLLRLAGEGAKSCIRKLKAQGIKTEPAFAQYFGIAGEPYQALLDLYDVEDEVLCKFTQICQDKVSKNSHTVKFL
jgi:hypothetical protein